MTKWHCPAMTWALGVLTEHGLGEYAGAVVKAKESGDGLYTALDQALSALRLVPDNDEHDIAEALEIIETEGYR